MKTVIEYFKEISGIPRCSGHETEIHDYLLAEAKRLGLEAHSDDALNVVIRKEGSKGYEDKDPVVLQGHMDMVCVKDKDSDHDFKKDPLDLKTDGDFLYAEGTSLGADDGIAVATALSILSDDSLEHPPIELVVTTGEEIGLIGANEFSEGVLKGTRMINIDTEEEGVLTVGCAGGVNLHGELTVEREEADGYFYEIDLYGMPGGHSGMEITKDIYNANKVMAEILENIDREYRLISFDGGTKHNAIPSDAKVKICFKEPFDEGEGLIAPYKDKDENIGISVKEIEKEEVMTKEDTMNLVGLISGLPHGVRGYMTGDQKGKPETSDNLAIVKTDGDDVEIVLSLRSHKKDQLDRFRESIERIFKNHNATTSLEGAYDPWEYVEGTELQKVCLETYKDLFGREMTVDVTHGGLECAVFESKYPELDAVSIGPDIQDVHSPKERLSLSSAERTYQFITEILKRL